MTGADYVGAIDQGTTGTRFMVFDRSGTAVSSAYETHEQRYPRPGWVEHDPEEIWDRTTSVIRRALDRGGLDGAALAAIGVANQRETTVVWDADSGEPLHPAIVWQDRRTTDRVEAVIAEGLADGIRETTGLAVDAYFSATKIEWLLSELDLRDRAERGEVCLGTVDAWLIHRLTGRHATDVTNASRTMLFDIHTLDWDPDLCTEFGVPPAALPDVAPSIDPEAYGRTDPDGVLGAAIPVTGVLGDQQAALFGQTCFEPGDAKSTYGTGSFVLMNTGPEAVASEHGLLTTVAVGRAGAPTEYALEGSVFVTGGAIEWLREIGVIDDPAETEELASSVGDTGDVFLVPAFQGLGAPFWNPRARGTIVGLTRGTGRAHLARATLEGIAHRNRDVVDAMVADSGVDLGTLRVDGGAVENDALCQLQADVLGTPILRPAIDETTALGAAYAAGLGVGYWESRAELRSHWRVDRRFEPGIDREEADVRHERWRDAVDRARDWASDG